MVIEWVAVECYSFQWDLTLLLTKKSFKKEN